MDNEMLEQIQQMLTAATNDLRQEIVEAKRYSGILAEDLHHKLDLVIEGQQFLWQDIGNVRSDMDTQARETRTLIGTAYRDLDRHARRLEQQ